MTSILQMKKLRLEKWVKWQDHLVNKYQTGFQARSFCLRVQCRTLCQPISLITRSSTYPQKILMHIFMRHCLFRQNVAYLYAKSFNEMAGTVLQISVWKYTWSDEGFSLRVMYSRFIILITRAQDPLFTSQTLLELNKGQDDNPVMGKWDSRTQLEVRNR